MVLTNQQNGQSKEFEMLTAKKQLGSYLLFKH